MSHKDPANWCKDDEKTQTWPEAAGKGCRIQKLKNK